MREKNTNENDPVSTLVHVCLSTISYAPCKCEGTKQVVINSSMDKNVTESSEAWALST